MLDEAIPCSADLSNQSLLPKPSEAALARQDAVRLQAELDKLREQRGQLRQEVQHWSDKFSEVAPTAGRDPNPAQQDKVPAQATIPNASAAEGLQGLPLPLGMGAEMLLGQAFPMLEAEDLTWRLRKRLNTRAQDLNNEIADLRSQLAQTQRASQISPVAPLQLLEIQQEVALLSSKLAAAGSSGIRPLPVTGELNRLRNAVAQQGVLRNELANARLTSQQRLKDHEISVRNLAEAEMAQERAHVEIRAEIAAAEAEQAGVAQNLMEVDQWCRAAQQQYQQSQAKAYHTKIHISELEDTRGKLRALVNGSLASERLLASELQASEDWQVTDRKRLLLEWHVAEQEDEAEVRERAAECERLADSLAKTQAMNEELRSQLQDATGRVVSPSREATLPLLQIARGDFPGSSLVAQGRIADNCPVDVRPRLRMEGHTPVNRAGLALVRQELAEPAERQRWSQKRDHDNFALNAPPPRGRPQATSKMDSLSLSRSPSPEGRLQREACRNVGDSCLVLKGGITPVWIERDASQPRQGSSMPPSASQAQMVQQPLARSNTTSQAAMPSGRSRSATPRPQHLVNNPTELPPRQIPRRRRSPQRPLADDSQDLLPWQLPRSQAQTHEGSPRSFSERLKRFQHLLSS